MTMHWQGVMPAMTTAFNEDLTLDYEFIARHASWMTDHGCTGIVTPGSLGEGNTLTMDERGELWATLVKAAGDRMFIVSARLATSSQVIEVCALNRSAATRTIARKVF